MSINVGMYLESEQLVADAKRVNAATQSVIDTTQQLGSAVGPVDQALRSHVDNYDRMQSVLENTGFRINDLARQMSGLYQAQTKLAGSRKEMQSAFDDRLDLKIATTLDKPDPKSANQLQSDLTKQRGLISAMRSEYDQLNESIQDSGDKRAEVLRWEKAIATVQRQQRQVVDRNGEPERLVALQERLNNRLAKSRDRVAEIEAVESRLLMLRTRGKTLQDSTLATARKLVDARIKEAKAAQDAVALSAKIITTIRGQNVEYQRAVNSVDEQTAAFTRLIQQADTFNTKVQRTFSGDDRSSEDLAVEFYDAATALEQARARAAALDEEITKGKASNRDMTEQAVRLKNELATIKTLQGELPQLAAVYHSLLKSETTELERHEESIRRVTEQREKSVKAVEREAAAARRLSRSRDTNAANPSRGNRSTEPSEDLRKQLKEINEEIAEANDLLQQKFEWRKQLIAAGHDETAAISNIDELKTELVDLDRRRADIAAAVSNATRREEHALHNVHNLMSRLGSTDSARAQIQVSINRNVEEFNRELQQAIRSGQILETQANNLRIKFAQINTEANVSRQLNLNAGHNNFGFAVTQFSYGLEDFMSQIERGLIPALNGAANNINTIAQVSGGPYVALFTTATISAFMLANAMGVFADESETASQKLDRLTESSDYLIDKLEALKDIQELRVQIGWEDSLDELVGQYTSFSSEIMQLSRKQAKLMQEQRIKDLAEQREELDTISSYIDRSGVLSGLHNVTGDHTLKVLAKEAKYREKIRKKRLADLEAEENALGASLTEEERAWREVNRAIMERLKLLKESGEAIAATSSRLVAQSNAVELDDQRTILEVRRELVAAADEQIAKAKELSDIATKYEQKSNNIGTSEKTRADIEAERIELQERAIKLEGEMNQLAEKQVANAKLAQEMMKQNIESREELRKIIESYGTEEQKKMFKVRDAVAEIVEQAELLAKTGVAGDQFAAQFENVMDGIMQGLEAQRAAQQTEMTAPNMTSFEEETMYRQKAIALRQELSRLERAANNDPANKQIAEQRIAAGQELIEQEKKLWEAQKQRLEQNQEAWEALRDVANSFGTETEQSLQNSQEMVAKIAADALKFTEGNPGLQASVVFESIMDNILDGLERQREEVQRNGALQLSWNDQINTSVRKHTDLLAEQARLAAQAANTPADQAVAAAQLENAKQLLEAEKELIAAREDARQAVNDAAVMVQAHIGALDREFAVTQKIKQEREKLNDAIKAGLATGVLAQAEADKLKANFERIVRAQLVYTAAEERKKELEKEFSNVSSEFDRLNSMPSQSVSIATRGSAEAQQIMDRVFREGLKRDAQDPQIKALVDILEAINDQTDIMEKQEQIAATIGLQF